MWSAKQFFGTGPKSWVSISTPVGSEIGQVSDITFKMDCHQYGEQFS